MARHGKRVKVAQGIYRDATGYAVSAMVRRVRREQRYPLTLTLPELRAARKRLIETLDTLTPDTPDRGTVAAAVARYLERLPTGGRYLEGRHTLLAPWVAAHGSDPFATLTRAQIVATLMAWEREGLSAGTRNLRLSALRVLWRTVAPDDSRSHACERVARVPASKARRNRARPLALIAEVLTHVSSHALRTNLPESHAKHQLTLLAWTGQPAATLARVTAQHVRWDTQPPEVYLQPRRKGAGSQGRWIPLLPQAADALRAWLALDATSPWDRCVIRAAWKRAVTKAQAALRDQHRHADADALDDMRVYDLRHSFLTAMVIATGDVYAVSEYAQHADLKTTMGYVSGASSMRIKTGLAALAATVPQFSAATSATEPVTPQRKPASRRKSQGPVNP
jgi:site-specific recombinase XerC